jgi:hypothetical protein
MAHVTAQVIGSGSRGNQPGTAQLISNSPRRTCNIRRPGKSTCSAVTRAAASKPDNTGRRLRAVHPRSHPGLLRRSRVSPGWAQLVQRKYHLPLVGREQPLLSRRVPRPDGYSTSPSKGKAADGLAGVGAGNWGSWQRVMIHLGPARAALAGTRLSAPLHCARAPYIASKDAGGMASRYRQRVRDGTGRVLETYGCAAASFIM